MKKFRKITAALAATLMAATMAAPMTMNFTASAVNVGLTTNNTSDNGIHTYEAYQIFSATAITDDGVLTGIQWGSGITSSSISEIYTKLAEITETTQDENGDVITYPFKKAGDTTGSMVALSSAEEVAKALSKYNNDDEVVKQFADIVAKYIDSENKISEVESKLTISSIGYYLIQDASSPTLGTGNNSGAKTRYILNVIKANEEVTVTPKSAAPTVDKQVLDEANEGTPISIGNDGVASNGIWGEVADHAINEKFQFKLIATIPTDAEINSYEKYHVKFLDSMSAGVTFDGIASVKVYTGTDDNNGVTVNAYNSESNKNGYYANTTEVQNGSWSLTIGDIKKYLADNKELSDNVRVEVIYNAHLNENAIKHNTGTNFDGEDYSDFIGANINYNDVYLKYSNNPTFNFGGYNDTSSETPEDSNHEGETPKDTVGVFTYTVDNTKTDDNSIPLNDAEFELYAGDSATGDPIKLVYDSTLNAYRMPKLDGSETNSAITTIKSQGTDSDSKATGKFNFVGLDAGTYTLKETKAPEGGYNLSANNIKIQITAIHTEKSDGTGAVLDLTNSSGMNNTVINKKGSALPSTGGIGTTLFYVGGGCMVAVAGIFLITKKRMGKDED